jgi:hypothetical protein
MFASISKVSIIVHINMVNNAWDIASVIIDGYVDFAFLDLSGSPVGE